MTNNVQTQALMEIQVGSPCPIWCTSNHADMVDPLNQGVDEHGATIRYIPRAENVGVTIEIYTLSHLVDGTWHMDEPKLYVNDAEELDAATALRLGQAMIEISQQLASGDFS